LKGKIKVAKNTDIEERTALLVRIKELRAAGNSISRTAQIMELTRGTVNRWINEEKPDRVVKKMDPYISLDEKTAIVVKWAELIASGESRSDAAASVGFPTMMLNRWLMSEPALRVEFQESVGKKQNNTGRKSFESIMTDVRAGRPVWRDGGRFKLQLVEAALMRYELDGANVWRCKGFATLSGTDVLARDWTVIE